MSQPKKPEDPQAWPQACARCTKHYPLAATWPEGRVCGYCYKAAQRVNGTCGCGHTGVLPGLIDGRPACRRCSGIRLNVDCLACGAETELHSGGRCWACVLGTTVDQILTDSATGTIIPALQPIAAALKAMPRANSGLTWIRQAHVTAFLTDLAHAGEVSHESLDALPASKTRDYVRGLLVEHGVLERRDELRVRYIAWADTALERLTEPEDREAIQRYIRWHHLRRMNQTEVTNGTFLRAKQTVTVAIDLLIWLRRRGTGLTDLTQTDLDHWQAEGNTTREIASRFLRWAINTRLVAADLTMTPHRRGTSRRSPAEEQSEAIQRVVHTDELTPRDRFAAILILVFGQQIAKVASLTWDDVTISSELASITLSQSAIALEPPLDGPLRLIAAQPQATQTAAHPNSRWIFPGYSPGRHIDPAHLRERLRRVISTRAARLGSLHEMTKLAPTAILAEVLGYNPQTIDRHARASASTYAQYVAILDSRSAVENGRVGSG